MARKSARNGATGGVKKRALKDPNAPKRALSAYLHFSNEKRDELKKNDPNMKFSEVGKVLGERWRQMTDDDKQPYNDKAQKGKEEYERQMEKYRAEQTAAANEAASSSA